MYEKILVPLDGSKVAEAILPHVKNLVSKMASEVKVELILLHVLSGLYNSYPDEDASYVDIPYSEEQMAEAKTKALEYLGSLGQSLKIENAKITLKVESGDAPHQVARIAEEAGASVIAISTHGRSGVARWALGSTTDKLLHIETKIPILIIRAPIELLKK